MNLSWDNVSWVSVISFATYNVLMLLTLVQSAKALNFAPRWADRLRLPFVYFWASPHKLNHSIPVKSGGKWVANLKKLDAGTPSCASEITNFTPRNPRRARLRKSSIQNGPVSLCLLSFPAPPAIAAVAANSDNGGGGDDAVIAPHVDVAGRDALKNGRSNTSGQTGAVRFLFACRRFV
jgi:hypothetical protein